MNLTLRIKAKQLGWKSAAGREKCLHLGNNENQKNDIFHQL